MGQSLESSPFPQTLHVGLIVSLIIAMLCGLLLAGDELRRPQTMWIMNLVWPITALFGSLPWVSAYVAWGRTGGKGEDNGQPFAAMVLKATGHCGAGCTLADIIVEWTAFALPAVAVFFGWHSFFRRRASTSGSPTFYSRSRSTSSFNISPSCRCES
jgi:hypothetical protein